MKHNIITATDLYKVSHWQFYPKGMTNMRSYFEARIGAKYPTTVFFGLQYILQEFLVGVVVTKQKIASAEKLFAATFSDPTVFNKKGWEYILKTHGGKLPISIRAIPEGTNVPINNALMCVEITDDKCAWLVNYLETILSHVW